MGEVGHAAPSGTVVSEFVERPHGASAAAIVRSSKPILIRPRSTGSVSIVGPPMHRVNRGIGAGLMHRSIGFTAVRHGRSLEIAGRHRALLSTSAASAVIFRTADVVGHLEREPAGHYRLGEDGAPADAACQHRRITLGKRLCNLMGIDVVRVAAVENDPSTEPRPKRVRFVDEPERLGESRTDERRR
jgi:hypothetical protein